MAFGTGDSLFAHYVAYVVQVSKMEDYRVPKEHYFQPYAFNGGSVALFTLSQH